MLRIEEHLTFADAIIRFVDACKSNKRMSRIVAQLAIRIGGTPQLF